MTAESSRVATGLEICEDVGLGSRHSLNTSGIIGVGAHSNIDTADHVKEEYVNWLGHHLRRSAVLAKATEATEATEVNNTKSSNYLDLI